MITEIKKLIRILRYFPLYILTGLGAGLIGYLFRESIHWAGLLRKSDPLIVFLLPVTAIIIQFVYRRFLKENPSGTKTVISAVKEKNILSYLQLPLVFFSSVLTHLSGGSAGREGAVLEMGGVIGEGSISLLRLSHRKKKRGKYLHILPNRFDFAEERQIAILCGMAGAFSALFVTPLAAVFFALEITDSHQVVHRFIPVFLVSAISFTVVCFFGWQPLHIPFYLPNPLPEWFFAKAVLLAIVIALIGRFFCFSIHYIPALFSHFLTNVYIRSAAAAVLLLLVSSLLHTDKFNGLGEEGLSAALDGNAGVFDFFWKTVLTALTLAAGMKGGEIVPAFFVGGVFGASFSSLIGFLPDFGATIGIVAILAAVAKTPIAAVVLGVELFGMEGTVFYLPASFLAWFLSGKRGLYT